MRATTRDASSEIETASAKGLKNSLTKPRDKAQRQEHAYCRDRRGRDGCRHLFRAVKGRDAQRFAPLVVVAVDILKDHDTVVYHAPDGHRQTGEAHDIERQAEYVERGQRNQHRQRDMRPQSPPWI